MLRHLLFLLLTVASIMQLVTADNDDKCETVEAEIGTCIILTDCDIIYESLKAVPRPIPEAMREYFMLSHCGFKENMPKVCCPKNVNNPDSSNHQNTYLLKRNVCGIGAKGRVINGTAARINEFPWMALLVYNTPRQSYQCGGSVITERYVLTAGHCITSTLKKVRIGEHTISTDRDCESYLEENFCAPPIQEFGIEKTIRHKMYYQSGFLYDIALIRLDGSIDFHQGVLTPVCLPLYDNLMNSDLNSKNLTVTGWGLTEENKQSDVLQKVSVKVIDNEECQKIHRLNYIRTPITRNKLCAGIKGQDSCSGDSGGPLIYMGNYANKLSYVQYGIVSYGYTPCGTDVPAVYTRVAKYMNWILNNLQP